MLRHSRAGTLTGGAVDGPSLESILCSAVHSPGMQAVGKIPDPAPAGTNKAQQQCTSRGGCSPSEQDQAVI